MKHVIGPDEMGEYRPLESGWFEVRYIMNALREHSLFFDPVHYSRESPVNTRGTGWLIYRLPSAPLAFSPTP